jgi:NTE family protein
MQYIVEYMKGIASKTVVVGLVLLLLSGCASFGVIKNDPLTESTDPAYSIKNLAGARQTNNISLTLSFSGGGTRAAALAYGVLEEMRDTTIMIDGQQRRLLDEIDVISSVSGGSFTSAYYGLHGDGIFTDFEKVFLRKDLEAQLFKDILNPFQWFSSTGRTERAIQHFENSVFQGATFADLYKQGGPLIIINASDLGYGVRFSFIQEYFDLLCSDISTYPVARAVTASAAVPLLFNPVVVENYHDCNKQASQWLLSAENRAVSDLQLARVIAGLQSYFNDNKRRYIHLVDGGITDNLGLRAFYEVVEMAGGVRRLLKKIDIKPAPRFVIISVDAATDPDLQMDSSKKIPSIEETVNAVTDAQVHLYNAATIDLMQKSMRRWADELSTAEQPVEPYFIQIGFKDIMHADQRRFINNIPTSFALSDEQIDALIAAGHELLRNNREFQRFIKELENNIPAKPAQRKIAVH